MIEIEIDEAYAYDYLSILALKGVVFPSDQNDKNLFKCVKKVQVQVGLKKHGEIVLSKEYMDLTKANENILHAIEVIRGHRKTGETFSAKDVDDMNLTRYYSKQRLQEKFFPGTCVTETKS